MFDSYIPCCTITLRDVLLSVFKQHFVCFRGYLRIHFTELQIPKCMLAHTVSHSVFTTEIRLNIFLSGSWQQVLQQKMVLLLSLYFQPIHLSPCDFYNRGCFILVCACILRGQRYLPLSAWCQHPGTRMSPDQTYNTSAFSLIGFFELLKVAHEREQSYLGMKLWQLNR